MEDLPKSLRDPGKELKDIKKDTVSEFAEKPPLIYPHTVRKIIRYLLLTVGLIVVLAALIIFARILIANLKKTPAPINPNPPVETQPVISTEVPLFAYIKDRKSIWISDLEGVEKAKIIELSPNTLKVITALSWKGKNELGYSVCEKSCEILVYNFQDKSVSQAYTTDADYIKKFTWDITKDYLSTIETKEGLLTITLKLGTVNTKLKTFLTETDETNTKSRLFYTTDGQH